jgi:hypothetical protein
LDNDQKCLNKESFNKENFNKENNIYSKSKTTSNININKSTLVNFSNENEDFPINIKIDKNTNEDELLNSKFKLIEFYDSHIEDSNEKNDIFDNSNILFNNDKVGENTFLISNIEKNYQNLNEERNDIIKTQ